MKLLVFSSNLSHINQEIENLNSLSSQRNMMYEAYNTNSLIGMQKAVQFNVFGAFQSILLDDFGQIRKRFDNQIPNLKEILAE
jgi:hypothetical protein